MLKKLIFISIISIPVTGGLLFSAEIPQEAKVCTGCHTFEKGGTKKVGPNLFGVFGRESSVAGGGWKWTEENMDKWLDDPVSAVKTLSGKQDATSKMTIPKIKDKEKRKAIIEFLKSLKE